jgi:prolipoprotein diacylglyceryltransferase
MSALLVLEGSFSMYGIHVNEFIIFLIPCLFGLLGLAATAFWIWMLVDCAQNEPSEGNDKIAWILVIAVTSFIGAAIYYFVRRPERKRGVGR